jgi:hypothetical protein
MADIGDGSVGASLAYNARMYQTGGLTWGQYVENLAAANGIDGLTEFDIDEILWEHTAWPMAEVDYVRGQILELFTTWKEKPRER